MFSCKITQRTLIRSIECALLADTWSGLLMVQSRWSAQTKVQNDETVAFIWKPDKALCFAPATGHVPGLGCLPGVHARKVSPEPSPEAQRTCTRNAGKPRLNDFS